MEKLSGKSFVAYLITFSLLLVCDLITKDMAERYLLNKDISLLPFLHLVLVYNRGVAFGFLSDAPDFIRLPIMLLTPIFALILTFLYAIR
ncbi:MAG: signal peptidase II, partial [Hydrogenobacter thermophilus]|nr:signal peptidase II [Hydrogenobacter thermophilus]